MSLLLLDGFDHYATALLPQKWDMVGSAPVIQAGSARTGAAGLQLPRIENANSILAKTIPATATVLLSAAIRPTWTSRNGNAVICSLLDATGTVQVGFGLDNTGQIVGWRATSISSSTAATWATGVTLPNGSWQHLAVKATLHPTAGAIELRLNGDTVWSVSGTNTRASGSATTWGQVRLGGSTNVSTAVNAVSLDVDDLAIIAVDGVGLTDFPGDCTVQTLAPAGDGTYQEWTPTPAGSHYATVDESTPDTSDYVAGGSDNLRDTWTYGAIPAGSTVKAVQVNTYAAKDAAGPRSLAALVRSGGSDAAGTDTGLSTDAAYYRQLWTLNPVTSAAWTASQINAAEFGVKARP